MRINHAEAARYARLIAELARLARVPVSERRRPTPAEVDAGIAAQLRRYASTRRPRPVSTLTGRPTPELPEDFHRLGPLPADPHEGIGGSRRRLPPPCHLARCSCDAL